MKLKNISRQIIKPWYYIHVTKINNTNKESEDLINDRWRKERLNYMR